MGALQMILKEIFNSIDPQKETITFIVEQGDANLQGARSDSRITIYWDSRESSKISSWDARRRRWSADPSVATVIKAFGVPSKPIHPNWRK